MKIRHYISIVFILFVEVSWNQNTLGHKFECENAILLLSADSDSPVLELNTNQAPDSLIEQVKSGGFCINIPQENRDIKLLLNSGRNTFNDSIIRCFDLRTYYNIDINALDMILFEGKIASLDSLKRDINKCYLAVGDSLSESPETLSQVSFVIDWQSGCSQSRIEEILIIICCSYLEALEYHQKVNICKLSSKQIQSFKANYPLKIMFQGHSRLNNLEEIIIIEDSE